MNHPEPLAPARATVPPSFAMAERELRVRGLEVLAKLSAGGMGEVLLARRRGVHGFEKLLAVKVIKGELARRPDIRSMFHDEARLVARIFHPNVAQVYDFGESEGVLYLAMEYVPGLPLHQLLATRGRPLPPLVAARIVSEAARGLHAAHELTDLDGEPLGVVHRDVSPGNLILTYDGRVKILDFGIAFMTERESPDTVVGELKGKPSYMAPEQLRAERVDRRSDIYALCVVLHELLTGRKLFTRGNVVATALAVERGEVPQPSLFVSLPDGLEAVVMRGLEKAPEHRHPDARALAEALDQVVQRENGPTLEGFVESELAEPSAHHRAWLQRVLTRSAATEPAPVIEAPPPAEPTASARARSRREDGPPTPVLETRPEEPSSERVFVPAPPSRPAWPAAVAVFAAVIGLAAAVRAFWPSPPAAPSIAEKPVAAEFPAVPNLEPPTEVQLEPIEAPIPEPAEPEEPARAEKLPSEQAKTRRRRQAEPAPAEPEKPAEAAPGKLTVGARPYALVRLDGRDLGATPLVGVELPAGRYRLQLLSPDTGELRYDRDVLIQAGREARVTAP